MVAANRSSAGEPVTRNVLQTGGPFVLFESQFAIVSSETDQVRGMSDDLHDLLRAPSASTRRTEYRLERTGPTWHTHSWGVWRDGLQLSNQLTAEYATTFVLSDIIGTTRDRRPELVGLRGSAATRNGRTAVFVDSPECSEPTSNAWWSSSLPTAWLMAAGWSAVAVDTCLVDETTSGQPTIEACWRPFFISPGALLPDPDQESSGLVPASTFGTLASSAPIDAFFILDRNDGRLSSVEPISPTTALCDIARRIGGTTRRLDFRKMAKLLPNVPVYRLTVGTAELAGIESAITSAMGIV